MIYVIKSRLGIKNIYYKKDKSKRWDARIGTFGRTKDPRPRVNLRVGTQKARLRILKMRSETQVRRPWSETWSPNLFQRWNMKPRRIISISQKQSLFKLICCFVPRRAIYYYNCKIFSLKCLIHFQATTQLLLSSLNEKYIKKTEFS